MTAPSGEKDSAAPERHGIFSEKVAVGAVLVAIITLKLMAVQSFRVDSDETQHAHVVWGWATGRLQYRDLFDNHMPLFQALFAPFFAMFGEYANILLPLRLAMLPLYAACLFFVFRLTRILFSTRAAWCACLSAALISAYFYPSTEFRTDNFWAVCWYLSLATAVSGEFTLRRAFLTGLFLGLTTVVSVKTAFLGAALAIAAVFALGLRALIAGEKPGFRQFLQYLGVIIGGGALFPALVFIYFAARGAFGIFFYCVFLHNIVPGLKRWGHMSLIWWVFPLSLPFVIAYSIYVFRQAKNPALGTRRVLILITPYLYEALMYSYCPDLNRQDDLPYVPLLPITLIPFALSLWSRWPSPRLRMAFFRIVFPLLLLAEIVWIWNAYDLRGKGLHRVRREIALILSLTNKDDYVMDDKGDYIFRMRPWYWILEPVTRARLRMGLVKDDIPECLVGTDTKVSYLYPTHVGTRSAIFIARNYLPFDPGHPDIGVAGKIIGNPAPGESCTFEVAIPAVYAVASETGQTQGRLDDSPYLKPLPLAPGSHQFLRTAGGGRLAIIWEKAAARGFAPQFDVSEKLIRHMSKAQ